MNIFDGKSGRFVGNMTADSFSACERLIKIELDIENAVELYFTKTNGCVTNCVGDIIQVDGDGFCSVIK